uniref:Acyl carrier protein n=2 Tax=Parascaris univalens TaxID=6257 RepID=A0A915ALH1_PARUN
MNTFCRRFASLKVLPTCISAVRASSTFRSRAVVRLQPIVSTKLQKRFSQVEVFGPFDPPKQLTFKEVEDRVLKAIRAWDRFPQDRSDLLTLDASFVNDLGLDSLDHVEIIMSLEDEFGFEIPDTDADKLKTPRDISKYICEREDVYE